MEKTTALHVASKAAAIIATAGAVYLAAIGKDGWGWLLFAALVLN